ncbi:DUF4136 domain-containing protein [Myroides sp. LJL115]
MKLFKFLPLLALVLFMGSCGIQVSSNYDQAVNFNQFRTYNFFEEGIEKCKLDDITKQAVLSAIEADLQSKGYTKSTTNPQILVNIFTKTQQELDIQNNYNYPDFYEPYGYYGGWGYTPYWDPQETTTVTTELEGKLYIDILNPATKSMVWQGVGTGLLGGANTQAKVEALVQKYVTSILANYPPGASKKK